MRRGGGVRRREARGQVGRDRGKQEGGWGVVRSEGAGPERSEGAGLEGEARGTCGGG